MSLEQKTFDQSQQKRSIKSDPLLIEQYRSNLDRLPDGTYQFKKGEDVAKFDYFKDPKVGNDMEATAHMCGLITFGVVSYFAMKKLCKHYEWIDYLRIPVN